MHCIENELQTNSHWRQIFFERNKFEMRKYSFQRRNFSLLFSVLPINHVKSFLISKKKNIMIIPG